MFGKRCIQIFIGMWLSLIHRRYCYYSYINIKYENLDILMFLYSENDLLKSLDLNGVPIAIKDS